MTREEIEEMLFIGFYPFRRNKKGLLTFLVDLHMSGKIAIDIQKLRIEYNTTNYDRSLVVDVKDLTLKEVVDNLITPFVANKVGNVRMLDDKKIDFWLD